MNYLSCFISYGDPDEKIARKINDFLESNSIKTWAWFKDSKIGEWGKQIQEGLDQFECILLLVSKTSLTRNGLLYENRLALVDDLKPYKKRLIPILIDNLTNIIEDISSDNSAAREFLNLIKSVKFLYYKTRNKNDFSEKTKNELLRLLQAPQKKIMVIGATKGYGHEFDDNWAKKDFIWLVAKKIGMILANKMDKKPICLVTRGGGIDNHVCEGFFNASGAVEAENRLWLYPSTFDKIYYQGPGKDISISYLPDFEGTELMKEHDIRNRVLVSRMATDSDIIIALRGGRGIQYAFVISLGLNKKFLCVPAFEGMSEKLYEWYNKIPNIVSPEIGFRPPNTWDIEKEPWESETEAEKYAESIVDCALDECEKE